MPETAKRTARVPILGEDGRISDDYVPAAIGEGVESAQDAAAAAKSAKTAAETARDAAVTAKDGAESAKTAAESAKVGAESAKAAAESAKTSAEGSASQAATSAQKAADSAQQAADKAASVLDHYISSAQATTLEPGSQATASVADQVLTLGIPRGDKGEKGDKGDKGDPGTTPTVVAAEGSDLSVSTDDGTVTIDDSALRARISELEQQAQNVVTGTSTGLVAHGEDAFPQKPREVRVKGKTWVNRWPRFPTTTTTNGITLTCDETGLFKLTGTATARTTFRQAVSGIAANKTVGAIASASISNAIVDFYAYANGSYASSIIEIIDNTFKSATVPASGWDALYACIIVESGQTVNASFRVMLVDGTEPPDCFTPPASITSVQTGNLVTAGKNLLPTAGIADVGGYNNATEYVDLLPGTYTIGAQGGPFGQIIVRGDDNTDYSTTNYTVSNATFTLNQPARVRFLFWNSDATGIFASNPQLELGSTATAYEPPTVTTTPLPEVELRSLPNGTCDELVIKADGTCEVERRTQLVDGEVTALPEPTTEPQSPVTLPALPAPTFNVWHDSDVPSNTTVNYERDINIAFDNLAKQVAGTASAVAVREASTIEEE